MKLGMGEKAREDLKNPFVITFNYFFGFMLLITGWAFTKEGLYYAAIFLFISSFVLIFFAVWQGGKEL